MADTESNIISLRKRALSGLVKLTGGLAVLLFLPALTFHFWQAWAYITLFCVATFSIIQYFLIHDPTLVERRLRAGASAETEPAQKKIQTINTLLAAIIYIISGLDKHFHWGRAMPVARCITGLAGVAGGLYLIFKVFEVNTFTSGIVETTENQKVIDTGLYQYVRHPMYSGAVLIFIATPFALGSYPALLPVLALLFMIDLRLRHEEKYLQKHLNGYTGYLQKTKYRLIPGIY